MVRSPSLHLGSDHVKLADAPGPFSSSQLRPRTGLSQHTGITSPNNNKSTNPRSRGSGKRSIGPWPARTSRSCPTTKMLPGLPIAGGPRYRRRDSSTKSRSGCPGGATLLPLLPALPWRLLCTPQGRRRLRSVEGLPWSVIGTRPIIGGCCG